MVQLSHLHMTTGKTIALTRWGTFVSKVMSLLCNMLSRLVITFLPRSKSFNFMAAVTICSDFGAQGNKGFLGLSYFPSYPCAVTLQCLCSCFSSASNSASCLVRQRTQGGEETWGSWGSSHFGPRHVEQDVQIVSFQIVRVGTRLYESAPTSKPESRLLHK